MTHCHLTPTACSRPAPKLAGANVAVTYEATGRHQRRDLDWHAHLRTDTTDAATGELAGQGGGDRTASAVETARAYSNRAGGLSKRHMAEAAGFEPARGINTPNPLSRRAH